MVIDTNLLGFEVDSLSFREEYMSRMWAKWTLVGLVASMACTACGGDDSEGAEGVDTGQQADSSSGDDVSSGDDAGPDSSAEDTTTEPDGSAEDVSRPDTSTLSCSSDDDCDDGNACNGDETCDTSTGTCELGDALACAASDACHTAECDPEAGCVEALIDLDDDGFASTELGECGTDCDDENAAVNPDAEEVCDGADNDCNAETRDPSTRFIADCDLDGFTNREAEQQLLCEAPTTPPETCPDGAWEEFADTASDCCALSGEYYPGSEVWIADIPVAGEVLACEDFDSNCDGEETHEFSNLNVAADAPCEWDGTTCVGEDGWTGNRLPSCGFTGEFSNCTGRVGSSTCNRVVSTRDVRCR